MALDAITGVEGTLSFLTGHNLFFNTAQLSFGQRIHRVTKFTDTAEVYKGGIKGGGGSVSGVLMQGAGSADSPGVKVSAIAVAPASMTIGYASGCSHAFNALVANASMSSDIENSGNTASYSFTISGDITETWS